MGNDTAKRRKRAERVKDEANGGTEPYCSGARLVRLMRAETVKDEANGAFK